MSVLTTLILNGKTYIFFQILTIFKAHLTSFLTRFIKTAPSQVDQ